MDNVPQENRANSSYDAEKAHASKKPQNPFETKLRKEKKTAEKNARLIRYLSTVIAFNPYEHPVASTLNTLAWRRAVESLIEENVLENTSGSGARRALQGNVIRCVTDYKAKFVIPEPRSRPNRELTEIETLAKEVYLLQENGAPNPMRKKADEKCLKDGVVRNFPVNHGVGFDAEQTAGGETAQNLVLVQCDLNGDPRKIVLSSPSSGVKMPIPRAGSSTPTPNQYFLLCPTSVTQNPLTISQEQPNPEAPSAAHKPRKPGARAKCALCPYRPSVDTGKPRSVYRFPKDDLRQKKWITVCRQVDRKFKLRRDAFVCEEHFTPESFGVTRVRNGVVSMRLQWFAVPSLGVVKKPDGRNCEAASESDEEMDIEEDILEYDNGLPTALDLPSGLPNSRDRAERLFLEEGKENICEYISCSTCGVSQEPCWKHAEFINDKNTTPLALTSLPRQLHFKSGGLEGSPLGVLSRVHLRSHSVFGPMRGALCSHISSRFAIHDATSWKCYHLDSDDTCNWMKYVQFAHNAQEQNVAVYVKDGQIFFVTTRDLKPYEELKLWYSRKYADGLGLIRKDQQSIAKDVEVRISAADDEISQKDYAEMDFVESEENDFALTDFDEMPDPLHDTEELAHDSTEHTASPRSNRVKRKKLTSSINEMTDNKADQEAIPAVDNENFSAEQSTNRSDFQQIFDAGLSDHVFKNSSDVPPVGPEKSDQISGSNRKKVKTGRVKKKRPKSAPSVIKFGCVECRLRFPTEKILRLHNFQHSDDLASEERTCPECGAVFDELGDLSLHVKEHGKKYFPKEKCIHCDELIAFSTMKQHFWRQHPEQSARSKLTCIKCGMEFDSLSAYRAHTANHNLRTECLYCGQTEATNIAMGQHLVLHKKQDGFHCPKCPKAFIKYDYLKRHYHKIHDRVNEKKKPKDAKEKKDTKGLPQMEKKNRKVSKFLVDPSTRIKFPCQICRKSYKTEALLEVHRRFHETESDKSYTGDDLEKACPECGEEFDALDALFRHVEGYAVSFYAREQCPVCEKFISSSQLQRHIEGNHPSGQAECEEFPCEVCKKVFPSEIKHRAHIQMHKPKSCLLCAEIFDQWQDLGKHARTTHKQADGFHCPNCERVFDTFRRLTNHHRNLHDIRQIVSCEICDKMCKNKQRLHQHMDVEHGLKEFTHECDVCNKKFMRQATLRNHVAWAHTAVGRKKVQGYQVAFLKNGYVAPRKRMLLDEFPFKCETCQVGFLTEGRILRHKTKFHPDEA